MSGECPKKVKDWKKRMAGWRRQRPKEEGERYEKKILVERDQGEGTKRTGEGERG